MSYRTHLTYPDSRALGLRTLGLGVCMSVVIACGDSGGGESTAPATDPSTEPATDPGTSTVDPSTDPPTTDPETTAPTTTAPTTDPTTTAPTTDPTTGDPTTTDPTDTDTSTGDPPVTVAGGPSKGGPIAVNAAGDTLAVANKGTDDVTLFELNGNFNPALRARVSVGDEPVSVSWSPDGHTLYVVNRASADVMKIADADTDAPAVAGAVAVGSEPIHGALSPVGGRLYVSSWVDGTLQVVDTAGMTVSQTVDLGGNPYAVCVTNNGDENEDDETIYVTDFYARPIAGEKESTDGASQGRVWFLDSGDYSVGEATLSPLADAGIPQTPGPGVYPNQLYACVVNENHVSVTAVGASPASFMNGTDFHQNVQGMIYAISLLTNTEIPERTVNINALVDKQAAPKRFVAIPTDIAFEPGTELAYVTSLASDTLQRVDFGADPIVAGTAEVNFLQAAKSPTGVAIAGPFAYVINEVSRAVTVVELPDQSIKIPELESAPQPADPAEQELLLGQRFFETGLGRWSANGWVSCAACHPSGTTDNVSWSFPAGPRQTSDTSATFDKSGAVQRVLNWTAIFDEVHDFELNTRGVANGTGAIVNSTMLNMDGTPNLAARIDITGPGGIADPQNAFNKGSAAAVAATGATPEDWDHVEAYIRSLRSPRGRTNLAGDPDAGKAVFMAGGCQNCHGGPLWTSSERYYAPLLDTDASLTTLAQAGVANIGMVRPEQVSSTNTSMLSVIKTDGNGAPHRHTCVVRKVGTFDADGPGMRGSEEVRQNGMPAQGVDGYNIPSLLGMATGAPYLHNGAAVTLDELLSNTFFTHLTAGTMGFDPSDQEKADLIAFILSIDDSTPPIPVPAGQRFCPQGFVPQPG
jgi:YVTN family beta-propeller protein